MESTKTAGLYIHVPFCKGKCPYCKFYSRKFPEYDETTARSFKQAVIRDVRDWSQRENLTFDTVFFGGGTPSLLFREAADIIAAAGRTYDCEITLEANPDDVTPQMLSTLRDGGVNRLSVGVQSLNDRTLAALGRRHSAKQAITAIEAADRAGFANISADIMLGVPGQTDSELRETIAALKSLPLTHYSAYLFESDSAAPEDLMAELYLT
ncbi:MAG: radical SAM protein, partial [Oscillospiraceae bacterium]|nr:radical SAM protein [Oscillospiraceae bacterium]